MNSSYLTDDELEHLIAEIEAGDLHPAPPGLLDRILEQADAVKDGMPVDSDFRVMNDGESIVKSRIPAIRVVNGSTGSSAEPVGTPGRRAKQSREPAGTAGRRAYFRRYCLRVATSVAAAIALLFLLPQTLDRLPEPDSFPVKNERTVYSREEMRDENRITRALRESHFLTDGFWKETGREEQRK